jgi:dipeptidyl aminopeptidase/acylaminoacyl peptidase
VRGNIYGFNPEDAFLASRGYAVLSPNFRGTTGYGRKHRDLGYKNWGKSMQDDLVDGMNWAVAEGIADKSKVCLYGASYGGYATLYGLVRDPDLFKCGVAFVAVSDINLLYDVQWSDTAQGDYFENESLVEIGDPKSKEDRAYFDSVSAVRGADRIRAPLLLAYGADDVRVPLIHGEKMKAALDSGKKKYEWLVYDGEGHGWNKPENRYDWYKRVDKFLAENLK